MGSAEGLKTTKTNEPRVKAIEPMVDGQPVHRICGSTCPTELNCLVEDVIVHGTANSKFPQGVFHLGSSRLAERPR